MPSNMDEELFYALTVLLEWAAQMGGWEAPCWEQARKVADRYHDQQTKAMAKKIKRKVHIVITEGRSQMYETHLFNTDRQANRFIERCEENEKYVGRNISGPYELNVEVIDGREMVPLTEVLDMVSEAINSTH